MSARIFLIFSLFFSMANSYGQDLTGTWEGLMGDEKLQVNIRMRKDELCGYTRDYVISNPHSHCKANFRGRYDEKEAVWILVGTSFIENSGSHILMLLRLWHGTGDRKNTMHGTVESRSAASSVFNMGSERESFIITRVTRDLPPDMPDCFPPVIRPEKSAVPPEATIKPFKKPEPKEIITVKKNLIKIDKPLVKKNVVKPADTLRPSQINPDKELKKIIPPEMPADNVSREITEKMNARKKNEFSRITVHQRDITLSVYDNGVVDNDSVSIFYNGKLLEGKKGLSEQPLVIHLHLDEKAALHEITMFAENLGTIPPNTALIVITAGDKRFELHSSASLTENAVMVLEYNPE